MKTKYLDNEIELLNSVKRNNEISDYGQAKLNEFNEIKKQLTLTDVSVSLFDTLQDLIEMYEEREAKASKMGNWSEAFQNEIRVGVLQHLAQLHKHKNNER